MRAIEAQFRRVLRSIGGIIELGIVQNTMRDQPREERGFEDQQSITHPIHAADFVPVDESGCGISEISRAGIEELDDNVRVKIEVVRVVLKRNRGQRRNPVSAITGVESRAGPSLRMRFCSVRTWLPIHLLTGIPCRSASDFCIMRDPSTTSAVSSKIGVTISGMHSGAYWPSPCSRTLHQTHAGWRNGNRVFDFPHSPNYLHSRRIVSE